MKKAILYITIFICSTAFSQTNFKSQNDNSFKKNNDEYLYLMRVADIYEAKTENEIKNVNYLKSQAHHYIDSAKVVNRMKKNSKTTSDVFDKKINKYVNVSTLLIRKADSSLTVANSYKDSVIIKKREAEKIKIAMLHEEDKNSKLNLNYVVQLGSGNINSNYFSKVKDVKIVKSNGGVNRYIVGLFGTKDEASAYKEKMIKLGFTDATIRTIDSLYE